AFCQSHDLFFFTHPAPTLIYSLSLHDALPIFHPVACFGCMAFLRSVDINQCENGAVDFIVGRAIWPDTERVLAAFLISHLALARSEEHTSELQSLRHLVCRLLLEKKKNTTHSP